MKHEDFEDYAKLGDPLKCYFVTLETMILSDFESLIDIGLLYPLFVIVYT